MLETSDYTLWLESDVFLYDAYLMTGITYVRNIQIIPYDWNKMCSSMMHALWQE